MKFNVGKFVIVAVYLGVMVVADGFHIQQHINAMTAKVNELLQGKPYSGGGDDDDGMDAWTVDRPSDDNNNDNNDDDKSDFPDWKNWSVMIGCLLLLPFVIFYTVRLANGRHLNVQQLLQWPESFAPRGNMYTTHRQVILPNLTLTRHVRRESLAENGQHLANRHRKMSRCVAELRKLTKKTAEMKEEQLAETKKANTIRRRH